jgi:hypothetical protein
MREGKLSVLPGCWAGLMEREELIERGRKKRGKIAEVGMTVREDERNHY